MKITEMPIEKLKEILRNAPKGATHFTSDYINDLAPIYYFKAASSSDWNDWWIFIAGNWHSHLDKSLMYLNLADIRARIAEFEPVLELKTVFKVGDRVVLINPRAVPSLFEVVLNLSSRVRVKEINIIDYGMQFFEINQLRHATPAEIAAGHRIDEPSSSCGMTAAEIDQFGEDLRKKPYVDLPEFEQHDSITAQLDPAKCRVVDPAVYEALAPMTTGELKVPSQRKHSHYFKDVSHLDQIDVYQVLRLFRVNDPCLQHIVKKALCAGQRGSKEYAKDVKEIADTANRLVEIEGEQGE